MIDKLLDFGSIFDWISPAIAEVQDHVNGPHHTLLIYDDCGWSGNEVARLLNTHGIKTWGAMIVNRRIMLTVPLGDVTQARMLLTENGIAWEQ